jgi:hypothetical protein
MNKRTIGVIATVATALLCGSPGILGIGLGAIAIFASYSPGSEIEILGSNDPLAAFAFGIASVSFGVILVAISIAVGMLAIRDNKWTSPGRGRTHTTGDRNLSDQSTYANYA